MADFQTGPHLATVVFLAVLASGIVLVNAIILPRSMAVKAVKENYARLRIVIENIAKVNAAIKVRNKIAGFSKNFATLYINKGDKEHD